MKGSYSVIKFVPDSIRFEPVNIGLVVQIGETLVTKMAEGVDPRIRLADPYADVESLREFLASFDASQYDTMAGPGRTVGWLHEHGLPNIFFSAPRTFEVDAERMEEMTLTLFGRLVERNFVRPPDAVRAAGTSAARTALRAAFRSAGLLKQRVEYDVPLVGVSGIERTIDFRYLTRGSISLVQTATTSLHEDMRAREHGYSAFLALLDTTRVRRGEKEEPAPPHIEGTLAVDASPQQNDVSAELRKMAGAYGFQFVAGQKGFFELASRIQRTALPLSDVAKVVGPAALLL